MYRVGGIVLHCSFFCSCSCRCSLLLSFLRGLKGRSEGGRRYFAVAVAACVDCAPFSRQCSHSTGCFTEATLMALRRPSSVPFFAESLDKPCQRRHAAFPDAQLKRKVLVEDPADRWVARKRSQPATFGARNPNQPDSTQRRPRPGFELSVTFWTGGWTPS